MKRMLIIFFLTAVSLLSAEELPVIRNPAKPLNADAGRTIAIKEVMRITDEEGDFYFKGPGRIKIAPDESIFLTTQDQFLRFDSTGKFLGNQQKKGEGPGEYTYIRNYFFTKNSVIIYAFRPPKIIETDLNGNLLKENRLKNKMGFFNVLAYDKGRFWTFDNAPFQFRKAKTGEFDINKELCRETIDGTLHQTGIKFRERAYMVKETGERGIRVMMDFITPVKSALDEQGNMLYVSHTIHYAIKQVNLAKEKITAVFKRDYSGVPYQKPEKERTARSMNPSPPKFFNDIQTLYFHNNRLLVLTSTFDKDKGVLVDVFSKEGKYLDNFYLPLKQVKSIHQLKSIRLTFHKNYFFIVELDEEENPVVVKYEFQL